MEKQKQFHKQTLNSKDHKAMKLGAEVVKGIASVVCIAGLVVVKKDTLKAVEKGAVKIATKLIVR